MSLLTRFKPMKTLARFDPFAEFEDVFGGMGMRPFAREYEVAPEIRMDIDELEKSYQVMAEIPGVKKEDIAISVDRNQVSISAEVKREKPHKDGEKTLWTERIYGKAYRSFTLPIEIDETSTEARFENGVLTLTLPKKPNAVSRRIAVN